MPRVALNKSWKQHPTKQLLYDHLPSISQTVQVRRARHTRLLEKQGRSPKKRFSMEPYIWTCQCWSTSKILLTSALRGPWM